MMLQRFLSLRKSWSQWTVNAAIAGFITTTIIALRFVGVLQLWELALFDVLMQARPKLGADPRIVIVGFDEADIKNIGTWPIPDDDLAELLNRIKAQDPSMIGLDIYRDLPVGDGYDQFVEVMETTPNLIGIQRVVNHINTSNGEDDGTSAIAPPPVLDELGQVGANDFPWDIDSKVRRGFLYLSDLEDNTVFSFAFRIAMQYLASEEIEPEMLNDTQLKLGEAVFSPLEGFSGGYVREDSGGYQVLLNYRAPHNSHRQVSLTEVLAGNIEPDVFRDRIVLIGSTAPSLKDYSLTPYSNQLHWERGNSPIPFLQYTSNPEVMTGVEVHANLLSFLLDAAQGKRSPLRTLPEGWEWLLIGMSATVGATWVAQWRTTVEQLDRLLIRNTLGVWLLWSGLWLGTAYGVFLFSWWLPLVPSLLALSGAASVKVGTTLIARLLRSYQQIEDYARTLEVKVEQRTEELRAKNHTLEQTLDQLQTAQQQVIAQERLASLGSLTAGVAHEIRNPLNFVNNFAHIAVELTSELAEELTELDMDTDTQEAVDDIFLDFKDCVSNIQQNGQRIEKIVESMLSHTHADAGQPIASDVNALLKEAVELVTYTMQAKYPDLEITTQAHYDSDIPAIQVVPQNMSKAFINILTNAWEALERRTREGMPKYLPELQVFTKDLDEQIEIRIQDNGDGIAEDIQGNIFDPFFTTKPTGEGTGLGLSLTHQTIVAGHQGAIAVESQPNSLTVFKITLPLTNQNAVSELPDSFDAEIEQGIAPPIAQGGVAPPLVPAVLDKISYGSN